MQSVRDADIFGIEISGRQRLAFLLKAVLVKEVTLILIPLFKQGWLSETTLAKL